MRVLVIDADEAGANVVAEGLAGVEPSEVRRCAHLDDAQIAAFAPDVLVVVCETPDRATLDRLRQANAAYPRPVVMFVGPSEPALAEAAVLAGVAAYVVDGLTTTRVRSVLEVAVARFKVMQTLRNDLAKAQADLAERKTVEKAKGLLMKERGLDEEAAYGLLRKLAMDTGRSIGAVATDLVAYAEVLKGAARGG